MNRITRWSLPCAGLLALMGCGGGGGGEVPNFATFPPPSAPTTTYVSVSAGGNHTCALSKDFTVYCWGDNSSGQLGIGTTTNTTAPGRYVPGLDDGIDGSFPASSGSRHSCAMGYGIGFSGYFVLCWADNSSGQLGDGTTTNSAYPSRVARAANGDVVDGIFVSPGGSHTCGFSGSRAYCWGSNANGQLGDGTTINSATPVAVGGNLDFSVKVVGRTTSPAVGDAFDLSKTLSAGADHTCGVTTAGAAYCWGSNASGQLGDGTTTSSALPVVVAGGMVFTMVSAGDRYACGITAARTAYCWGSNASGQLGNGTNTSSSVPVALSGGLALATVTAASNHACGLTTQGLAYCWGNNSSGQLGDGTTTSSPVPTGNTGLVYATVRAGGKHSCGITVPGVAYCWGDNSSGQLGNGTTTNGAVPVKVAGQA